MKEKEFKVFHLTGDDEVTSRIWDAASLGDERKKVAIEVAEGNPGCMTYLVELRKQLDEAHFGILCACLKVKKLKGSDLYSYIKKKSLDGAIKDFRKAGWI